MSSKLPKNIIQELEKHKNLIFGLIFAGSTIIGFGQERAVYYHFETFH